MAQMLTIASLAVNVKGVLGPNGAGFAISYAFLRFILITEYYRAGNHIPEAKALTKHYCIGFGAAAVLWVIFAFIPAWRYILWGIALIIDLLTP